MISLGVSLFKIYEFLIDELSKQTNPNFKKIISALLCVPGGLCVSGFGVRRSARYFGFAQFAVVFCPGFRGFARFQQPVHLTLPKGRDSGFFVLSQVLSFYQVKCTEWQRR